MKTPMTLGGIGPKLALVCLPYVLLVVAVMRVHPEFGRLDALGSPGIRAFGLAWLAAGLVFWASSGIYFVTHFGKGKLITGGPFALCRNPIYASLIVFVIPSLGILLRSGLVLSISVVLYIGFKIAIHGETILLSRTFGKAYDRYARSVNELFPFPRFL